MTLRRYKPIKPSRGTVIPSSVRQAIYDRDQGCVGPRVGMPGECFGGREIDHVRASHGIGMKSESTVGNGVQLCNFHHRTKTNNGREWRPRLIAYIESREGEK